jgi:hypothetical protein
MNTEPETVQERKDREVAVAMKNFFDRWLEWLLGPKEKDDG